MTGAFVVCNSIDTQFLKVGPYSAMTKYILDDDVAAYVAKCEAGMEDAPAHISIEDMRRGFTAKCLEFSAPHPQGLVTINDSITGPDGLVAIRIYRPALSVTDNAPGCLVYFHGGGWVLGDLESHDSSTADMAGGSGCVIIAVDYRLAPEHKFPAAIDDGWAVVQAISRDPQRFGIDASRIAVGGDSAGGGIAAAMTLMARENGAIALSGQVLMYPALGGIGTLPSYEECFDAPLLSTEDMHSFHEHYFGSRDLPDDPLASPLKAENFENLPPAYICCAQYDPLRDDATQYARRLEAAGVPVELHIEQGLTHAFLRSRHTTKRGGDAFTRICAAIKHLIGAGQH
jgi:acetyl esterase